MAQVILLLVGSRYAALLSLKLILFYIVEIIIYISCVCVCAHARESKLLRSNYATKELRE